jgi:geranylgeranyl pyrophosphate synthase
MVMALLSEAMPLNVHRARVAEYLRGIASSFSSVAGRIIQERLPAQYAGDPVRPSLVLWACAACGGDRRDALPVAAALDLFDRFMVLHDELVEDSVATVARWGLGQSLNAGDALYALAFRTLAADVSNAARRLAIAKLVAQAVLEAIEARNDDVGRSAAMRRNVVLTGAALRAGAMIAGASEQVAYAFARAGCLLGMAAIADDAALAHRTARKAVAAIRRCSPTVTDINAFEEVARYVARRAS